MFFIVTAIALVVSVIFTFVCLRLQKIYPDGTPALILFVLYPVEFAAFTYLINAIGLYSGGLLITLGVTIAMPPLALLGMQVSQMFGNTITDSLFASSMVTKAPHGYGKAKTLLVRGDVEGAIREYKIYFEADKAIPEPLFKAASLLIRAKRPKEAADMYRDLIRQFRDDIPVWSKAAFSLAQVLELHLFDKGAAEVLYKEILSRGRGTPAALWAANRQTDQITCLEDSPFDE